MCLLNFVLHIQQRAPAQRVPLCKPHCPPQWALSLYRPVHRASDPCATESLIGTPMQPGLHRRTRLPEVVRPVRVRRTGLSLRRRRALNPVGGRQGGRPPTQTRGCVGHALTTPGGGVSPPTPGVCYIATSLSSPIRSRRLPTALPSLPTRARRLPTARFCCHVFAAVSAHSHQHDQRRCAAFIRRLRRRIDAHMSFNIGASHSQQELEPQRNFAHARKSDGR